jgi:ABC-2 type transport system ATP-binding protein
MNNILEVRGLRKSYGSFTLEDITFAVPRGYIMGFVGPNGAGKTTTIKLILNVIHGESGSVKLLGKGGQRGQVGQKGALVHNEEIGVVMDTPLYVDDWTINDVEKALSPFYPQWNKKKFSALLRQFRLDSKKKVKELSRGMKVKLQIAAALSHNATLLILDEPTSGLDPVAREEISDLLREFISDANKSVLFSTHITSDLEKIADYITFILNGRLVFTGPKDALLEKYARITGGLTELTDAQKKSVIGYREHGTGFEGMVDIADIKKMPGGVLTEDINLEEIIIFMNKLIAFVRLDFITVKPYLTLKNLLIFIAVAIIMIVSSGTGAGGIGVLMIFAAMYASYPFAIGEKSGIDVLYATLSIRRDTVVAGRYLFAFTLDLCVGAAAYVLSFVLLTAMQKSFDALGTLAVIGILFLLFSVIQAVQLPIYFRLGYTKAKFLTYLPLIALPLVILVFANFLSDAFAVDVIPGVLAWLAAHVFTAVLLAAALWLVIMAVSYTLSLSLYNKRDF